MVAEIVRSRFDERERVMLAMDYPVYVVGSVDGEGSMNAMLACWVTQISFRPRLVAVSLENDARTLAYIRQTAVFSVNLLPESDGAGIARKVVMPAEGRKVAGRKHETIHHKLDHVAYAVHDTGVPVLLDGMGWYACALRDLVPVGDHTLAIGEVTDAGILRDESMLLERDLGWGYAG